MSDRDRHEQRAPIDGAAYRAQLIREGRLVPSQETAPPRRGESKEAA